MTGPDIRPTEVNPNFSTPLTSHKYDEAPPSTSDARGARPMESTNGQHSTYFKGNRMIFF